MLTVSFEQIPLASYALTVNNVALIRSVAVVNDSPESSGNLRVRISFDPEFAATVEEQIDSLPPQGRWFKNDVKLSVDTSWLCNMTEQVTVETTVEVLSEEGEVLAAEKKEFTALDYCQYWGNSFMPQYLAAFVTPRHIALDAIIKRASELLSQWTGLSDLSAYLLDVPNRPKMIVGALYEAIAEQNITYCMPTVTLTEHGQKIRTCEELLSRDRGMRGCCIDFALLMCSCLEAVGMHPLLVLQDGHAFCGCWLVNDMFDDSVNDDPSVLTKRTPEGINEIILVEMTCAGEGGKTPFDEAVRMADEEIKDVGKFSFVLDISRARLAGVHPVPQRIYNGNEYEVINPEPDETAHSTPEKLGETFTFSGEGNGFSRFDLWERRLLDLSTRNNLLNVRFSGSTLRIMTPSLPELVQTVCRGKEIRIIERPAEVSAGGNEIGDAVRLDPAVQELLRMEMEKNTLRSYQDQAGLTRSLTGLYRAARLSIEESGANTLYIALGFLRWFEQGKNIPRFAPVVLYPIRLERKSADRGYYMVSRGEDPLLNETLFEMLKQNFEIGIPDLSSALQNDNGVEIKYILAAVRRAVMEQSGWDVVEEASVSVFDFNRFVIWNDLRNNREAMSKHPLVRSLVEGRLYGDLGTDIPEPKKELSSEDIALPISADSSQISAIRAAASGKSFVLHGPPGTGKSQTITNIISNALFHGKRVLFVAEKMAALEVVQKRLAAIGLEPFCLELHSNKTKKSLVMDQLRKTTEVAMQSSDDSFAGASLLMDSLKRDLNAHVQSLHKMRGCGLSVYDCIVRYCAIDLPEGSTVRLPGEYIGSLTPGLMREQTEVVENYASVAGLVAEHGNALREIGLKEYSPDLRTAVAQLSDEVLNENETLRRLRDELFPLMKIAPDGFGSKQYSAFSKIVRIMLDEKLPEGFVLNLKEDMLGTLGEYADLREQLDGRKGKLFSRFSEHVFDIDFKSMRRLWMEAECKWFLPKYLDRRRVTNAVLAYSLSGAKTDAAEIPGILDELDDISRLQKEADSVTVDIDRKYGVRREIVSADVASLRRMCGSLSELRVACEELPLIGREVVASFKEGAVGENHLEREYLNAYSSVAEKIAGLEQLACASLSSSATAEDDYLDSVSSVLARWGANISELRSKVGYNVIRARMLECGLDVIVGQFETGNVRPDSIVDTYLKSLYRQLADFYISKDRKLSYFQSVLFEEVIKRFRKLCGEYEEITRKELVSRMTAMLPALRKEAAQSSDVGILQKCIRNGCRGVSIRKLFETIPDLIARMCPTMLMSPLSVSQYLGPDWPQFDLVIFDEASQMPTCEAVAAISRGKSVVIVGDEHQLPPTNFFMADNFSEQHSESEDLESILEDCLALSMPQKHLLWHYRSRHESLITFSNRLFYKNSLMTFPSNDDMATKVSFEYVNGVYERGSGRYNREEAKAVVAEVRRRLSDPRTASQSIGIVTFNVNQQALIEDLLNDMLRSRRLEGVASAMHERIFVKNLENVQGDERDVILFSVGYGRDRTGKVAMNFGPLNRDGGERRLNVAVSRARCEMKVFSSLRAADIDLYRSNAKGVKYLKLFLEYAERGNEALVDMEYDLRGRTKDFFVSSVAAALEARGYMVNTGIGSSEYRVDIGIVDPERPERYLLGLLCDGYNYASSGSARDRDVNIPSVLSNLGWRTFNIWSVEWWDTPGHVLDRIEHEIECAAAEAKAEEHSAEKVFDTCENDSGNAPSESGQTPGNTLSEPETTSEQVTESAEKVEHESVGCRQEYKNADLQRHYVDPVSFSSGKYKKEIFSDIRKILEAEAPISRKLLIKKLLNNFGIMRNGPKINAYLTEIFRNMHLATTGTDDVFFWKNKTNIRTLSVYRPAAGRDPQDIAPEEVAQAIRQVVKDQFAIDEDGLIRETAALFGFAIVRDNVLASMTRGLEYAMSKKMIVLDDGRYRLR